MRRPLVTPPDAFSQSPLLALLPVRGRIGRLEALTSSLYARYEKVAALRSEVGTGDREAVRRLAAEESMLKQVLEWLAVKPGEAP